MDSEYEQDALEPFGDLPLFKNAACIFVDPETFFPPRGTQCVEQARKICENCYELFACREYALKNSNLKGIWGGTTDTERRKMRKLLKVGSLDG